MPPPARYAPPHKQLGVLMVEARRRGVPVEEWWDAAIRPGRKIVMVTDPDPPVGAVLWPTDPRDRSAWRSAIIEGREGWWRAFERVEPTRAELALAELGEMLDELEELLGRDDLAAA